MTTDPETPSDAQMKEFGRKARADLTAAFHDADGHLSTDQVVEHLRQAALHAGFEGVSKEAVAKALLDAPRWEAEFTRIANSIEAELPGGRANPAFFRMFRERMLEWVERFPSTPP